MRSLVKSFIAGVGGAGSVVVLLGASSSVALSNAGIVFPDGTEQTTASAPVSAAWPVKCVESSVPPGSEDNLICSSTLTVPGGSITVGDGVPPGYYLLLTDIYLTPEGPLSATTTGYVRAQLDRRRASDGSLISSTRPIRLGSGNETKTLSFGAPLLVLGPGEYLGAFNRSDSTHSVAVHATGYLTDRPEMLGR